MVRRSVGWLVGNLLFFGLLGATYAVYAALLHGNTTSTLVTELVTDGPTNGRTVNPSNRDTRTHLKVSRRPYGTASKEPEYL